MSKPTIGELRQICQPNRGRSWSESIVRRFSIYITRVVIRYPINANQITSFSIFLSILAMIIIAASREFSLWIVVLVLLFFSYSLDYVDGEVARYHKTSSLTGLLLDRLASSANPCLLYLGIMYRSYLLNGHLLSIALGVLAILSIFIPRLTMSSMYQSAVEALMKTSNVSGTSILTKTTDFTTLDQLSEKAGMIRQIGWFLLGLGQLLLLIICVIFEFLLQNGVLPLEYLFVESSLFFPGFFLNLFLFYYGVLWLSAGFAFSYNVIRTNQVEGLYCHLLTLFEQSDEKED